MRQCEANHGDGRCQAEAEWLLQAEWDGDFGPYRQRFLVCAACGEAARELGPLMRRMTGKTNVVVLTPIEVAA